jgi:hypothetical protein
MNGVQVAADHSSLVSADRRPHGVLHPSRWARATEITKDDAMRTMRALSMASMCITAAACSDGRPDLVGHWISLGVESRPSGGGGTLYLRRDFTTDARASAARFDFYEDSAGATPSLTIWLDGPYTLAQPWPAVPGSWAGEFKFTALKITPKNQALTDLLNGSAQGSCGARPWQLGIEQDASDTGCLTLGLDLRNKGTEYDIVKRDGDKLYYGARPSDGSGLDTPQKRPTSLQVPLVLAR